MHIGIDYGSKLAGTTALAYELNGKLILLQSQKNKDADAFIVQELEKINVSKVFICTRYMRSKFSSPVTAGAFKPDFRLTFPVSAPKIKSCRTAMMPTKSTNSISYL